MYNRYIPSSDGTYHRQIVHRQAAPSQPEVQVEISAPKPQPAKPQRPAAPLLPISLDRGDLLVLVILFLILTDGEDADPLTLLITLAAFVLFQ